MANVALIRGAAMAAPKFTDIRAAVEPGIQTFKNIQALRQKEIEKREENDKKEALLDAKAYESLPALMTEGVPEAWQSYYNQEAVKLKDEAYALSQNRRNLDPINFIDEQRKLTSKINKMQDAVNWIKTYAAEEKADQDQGLEKSNSYTEDERELHLAILNMDVTPTMINNEPAIEYKNSDGNIIQKRLVDIERLQRKEYAKDNEIQKDLDSFLFQARKSGKFPGDPEFDDLLNTKLNSIEMNKHQARSLAIDVFGIGGSKGLDAINIPALRDAGIKIENFDQNKDGEIQQDEYEKMLSSIQSIDDLKNIVKEQYRQVAINQGSKYKESWEKEQEELKKLQAAKNAGFKNKWEYDTWLEGQEKRANAFYIKPLQNFLPSTPINEQQTLELLSYANNNIPNIEIYQNPEKNDDGELIAPNNYIIEVNGKQKFFEIDKTPGSTILKYIQDLYGYNAMERSALFGIDKKEEEDEFAKYETAPGLALEDINQVLEEERNKDTLSQLEPSGVAQTARTRIQREQAGLK